MLPRHLLPPRAADRPLVDDFCRGLSVLTIGLRAAPLLPGLDEAAALVALPELSALGARVLADERPDLIVAPLLSRRFDILDVGLRLTQLRFVGLLIALTPPLPDLRSVQAEVQAACPTLALALIRDPGVRRMPLPGERLGQRFSASTMTQRISNISEAPSQAVLPEGSKGGDTSTRSAPTMFSPRHSRTTCMA